MLDVVLYRFDGLGRLRLREMTFESILGLAHFSATRRGASWQWAEVATIAADGTPRVVRYSADDLRAIFEGSVPPGSPN